VRCLRCGQWGHGAGERTCPQFSELPPTDRVTKTLLDPMRVHALMETAARPSQQLYSYDNKGAQLQLKHAPLPMGASRAMGGDARAGGSGGSSSSASRRGMYGKGMYGGDADAAELLRQLDELQAADAAEEEQQNQVASGAAAAAGSGAFL
jgi:hypothetical protein